MTASGCDVVKRRDGFSKPGDDEVTEMRCKTYGALLQGVVRSGAYTQAIPSKRHVALGRGEKGEKGMRCYTWCLPMVLGFVCSSGG